MSYEVYMSPFCELYHHGIKGQKWGVRRYQNSDGSYTSAGKERRRQESGSPQKQGVLKKVGGAIYKFRAGRATRRLTDRAEERDRLDTQYALDKKYAKSGIQKAEIDATYKYNKTRLDYRDAKDRAILNKKYKNDPEYAKAMNAIGEQNAKDFLYGENGAIRYDTLINSGKSHHQAEAMIYTENMLKDVFTGAANAFLDSLSNKNSGNNYDPELEREKFEFEKQKYEDEERRRWFNENHL